MVYANSAIGDEDDCGVVMCIPQNDEQEPWTWCVIANVVDEHEVGVDHHIGHGTKIFSPGTKVYVSTEWRTSLKDDGGTLFVIGKARKQWRMVGMFIPRNRLTSFRVGRVFDPRVLRRMAKDCRQSVPDPSEWGWRWWGNDEDAHQTVIKRVEYFSQDGFSLPEAGAEDD